MGGNLVAAGAKIPEWPCWLAAWPTLRGVARKQNACGDRESHFWCGLATCVRVPPLISLHTVVTLSRAVGHVASGEKVAADAVHKVEFFNHIANKTQTEDFAKSMVREKHSLLKYFRIAAAQAIGPRHPLLFPLVPHVLLNLCAGLPQGRCLLEAVETKLGAASFAGEVQEAWTSAFDAVAEAAIAAAPKGVRAPAALLSPPPVACLRRSLRVLSSVPHPRSVPSCRPCPPPSRSRCTSQAASSADRACSRTVAPSASCRLPPTSPSTQGPLRRAGAVLLSSFSPVRHLLSRRYTLAHPLLPLRPPPRDLVKADIDTLGCEIVYKWLSNAPDARALFHFAAGEDFRSSPECTRHGKSILNAVGAIVAGLRDFDSLGSTMEHLGVAHAKRKVVAEQFPPLGHAIMEGIKERLEDKWTPEVANAWESVYAVISVRIVSAMEAARVAESPKAPLPQVRPPASFPLDWN